MRGAMVKGSWCAVLCLGLTSCAGPRVHTLAPGADVGSEPPEAPVMGLDVRSRCYQASRDGDRIRFTFGPVTAPRQTNSPLHVTVADVGRTLIPQDLEAPVGLGETPKTITVTATFSDIARDRPLPRFRLNLTAISTGDGSERLSGTIDGPCP